MILPSGAALGWFLFGISILLYAIAGLSWYQTSKIIHQLDVETRQRNNEIYEMQVEHMRAQMRDRNRLRFDRAVRGERD